MNLFDVYPLFDITPVKAEGSYIWDDKGRRYLDMYGGHAVISIGHAHPHYTGKLNEQLGKIAFYSNAVKMPLQAELAEKLGRLSGYDNYSLFLCNSGAEANENALKLASFHNGRKKVIAFTKSFHGRTSLAVAATDDASIVSPINQTSNITFLPFNNMEAATQHITDEVCAVIIEGIQGVGGVRVPTTEFLQHLSALCEKTGAILILDEVQSGYGRSGKFFAHQHAGIRPHLITVAKGMGNGFPVGGVLINPMIKARYGMLGTTFGGNYLACAAAIAVLDVIEQENLVQNAADMGAYIVNALKNHPTVKEIRHQGLMIGIELHSACGAVRNDLLFKHGIFTGSSSDKNTLRILPALNLAKSDADVFINAFNEVVPQTLAQP